MLKVFASYLIGSNILKGFNRKQRGFLLDKRGIREAKGLWEQYIHSSLLVGHGIIIKETYNPFAKVIQIVFYLACTGQECSLSEVYFGKILAEKIKIKRHFLIMGNNNKNTFIFSNYYPFLFFFIHQA